MNVEDFISTKFIKNELKWVFKQEFIDNAVYIKRTYQHLNIDQREIYKWYCYANIHTTMYQKNKIWEYLNGDINLPMLKYVMRDDQERYKEKL